MKSFHFLLFSTLCLVPLAQGALSANYITNFTALGPFNGDVNGKDGWSINDTTEQYSYVANWNSSRALGLGDASVLLAEPTVGSIALSHGYTANIGRISVDFVFAIIDSTSDNLDEFDNPVFTNRDTFGFSLNSGSGSLVSFFFVPEVPTPADPSSDSNATWALKYSVNGGPTVPIPFAVAESANYAFSLDFKKNSADSSKTDFKIDLTGGSFASNTITGLALDPNALTSTASFMWNRVGTNDYGQNTLLVDNLSLVPEPSSTLLFSFAALGMVLRRKRC